MQVSVSATDDQKRGHTHPRTSFSVLNTILLPRTMWHSASLPPSHTTPHASHTASHKDIMLASVAAFFNAPSASSLPFTSL